MMTNKTTQDRSHRIQLTTVEQTALALSPFEILYPPTEKIPVIVLDNFPLLGKLTAMRFLEWVLTHPEGVISLPTGKTPEYFIKWVRYLLKAWDKKETQAILNKWGIESTSKPDMQGLRFVQMDEFYPLPSSQTNSFAHYVRQYYIKGFGLDPHKALVMDVCRMGLSRGQDIEDIWPDKRVDLSLRYRHARSGLEAQQKSLLERVDQWCMEYEDRIRQMGGIGFFLGGIGPDGHIAFNIRGSDHYSTTRLCTINYETQAAASVDLGGIETVRKCLVVTIGLNTITYNPDCTAIIMAAGQAKAQIVARVIESKPNKHAPASALQRLPYARFYLTRGASLLLKERRLVALEQSPVLSQPVIEKILIDIAGEQSKGLLDLTQQDLQDSASGNILLDKTDQTPQELTRDVYDQIVARIERGSKVLDNQTFLHTEPHHDDIMLGYFAQLVRHFRKADNQHHFMTLTSGFTSVTNHFMAEQITHARHYLAGPEFASLSLEDYFDPDNQMARNRDVWQYLDGIAAADPHMKAQGCARRFIRNIQAVYGSSGIKELQRHLDRLEHYFLNEYPGKHDLKDIQCLKGMCREWEVECLWGYYGWNCDNVHHLRLGFYTGDIFSKMPSWQCDVMPIVRRLEAIRPDIVTVAFDPEASGPDTHYKVLQIMAEALRQYQENTGHQNIRVWGYRNVWYRFDPSEADLYVPVSLNMFSVVQQAFDNAFLSQRQASFPSHEHEGPFSELAQRIQVEQYQTIKLCLGRDWFYYHNSPLIRATRGFVFLKDMDVETFYESCRRLRRSIEEMT